jgi:hypothetical protein
MDPNIDPQAPPIVTGAPVVDSPSPPPETEPSIPSWEADADPNAGGGTAPTPAPAAAATPHPVDMKAQMTRTKVTVTSNNPRHPNDRELFAVANEVIGNFEYEVIFGQAVALPKVMIDNIKGRQCLLTKTKQVKGKDVEYKVYGPEFTVV